MDIGYAVTAALVTVAMVVSVRPLAHSGFLGIASWLVSDLVVESPFLGMSYLLVASVPAVVAGTLLTTAVAPWLFVAGASFVMTPVLLSRSLAAGAVLQHAGERAMGATWGTTPGPAEWRRRLPWHRIIVAPLPVLALGVRRRRGMRYGPARRHRLDVYRGRGGDIGRPVLIHLHGGGFRSGRRASMPEPCCTPSPVTAGSASAPAIGFGPPPTPTCSRTSAASWPGPGATSPIMVAIGTPS